MQPGAGTARRPFCADVSSGRGEPLAATASRIDHWLLVEHRGAWARDVLRGSMLSPELKAHLREQLDALAHARLLFVKKPERRAETGRHVFFGTSTPGEERLVELEVEHENDLLDIDFASGNVPGARLDGQLFVVCTHGKRDRCCARYGRPLYDALVRAADPDRVWQSTHVGGDRFAGNIVTLPHGLYYGRVAPDDVDGLLAEHAAGRLDLDRYRGRSAYPFPVQAAEQTVRESEGLEGLDDLTLLEAGRGDGGKWRVRFRTPKGAVHEVRVDATLDDEAAYLTCDSAEPRPPRRCLVTAHRVLSREL